MSYYIYRVRPFPKLEKLAEFEAFNDASATAKALRAAQSAETSGKIKGMFADNELQAEDMLCQVRVVPRQKAMNEAAARVKRSLLVWVGRRTW